MSSSTHNNIYHNENKLSLVNNDLHDIMEPQMHNSVTFISSEVSETLTSKRRPSIKSSSGQRRMTGGADDKTRASTSKTSNKIPENSFPVSNQAQKRGDQARCNIRNIQACFDSPRPLADSRLNKAYPSTNSLLGKEDSLWKKSLADELNCFCIPYATRSTGEKKIDEMMDYAIQNMNEAGKALTNLGDNFEHDLKLMFMDIMGRVQHWVSVVQNRILAAKADLESLRKESMAHSIADQTAKDLELVEVRKKLCEAEAKLAMQEQQRLEITPDVVISSDQATQERQERVSTSVQTDTEQERVEGGGEVRRGSAVTLVNTGCQSEDDRESTMNREAQLEAELAQLLEENDRLVKERAEYESAIQCALLKGVSSLNIEALKVLRCPPIPCCSPYGLSAEPIAMCRPRTRRCDTAPPQRVQRGSNAASENGKIDETKGNSGAASSGCCQPLLEDLLYCSGSNERAPENSMVFLLRHGDAGNQCQPRFQTRHRPSGSLSNRGSVCVGGKCRKPSTIGTKEKEKISCTTKSLGSRPTAYDLCVRNRDDFVENGTARKNTVLAKRCSGASNGNRRNKED